MYSIWLEIPLVFLFDAAGDATPNDREEDAWGGAPDVL